MPAGPVQKKSRPVLLVLAVVIVLVIGVIIFAFSQSSQFALSQSTQIVQSGTTFSLQPEKFVYYKFSVSTSVKLTGGFQASPDVDFYIMDPAGFEACSSSGGSSCYPLQFSPAYYKTFATTAGLDAPLPAGTFYLIFFAGQTGATITITQSIVSEPST
jgi:hypothetical protein